MNYNELADLLFPDITSTREDMEAFLGEGCERIGTSSAVKLLAKED